MRSCMGRRSFERWLSLVLYTSGHAEPKIQNPKSEIRNLGFRISDFVQMVDVFVQALDVMMIGVLRFPKLCLMTNDRHAVLTQRAVHVTPTVQHLFRPVKEDVQKQRVRLQMGRGQELEIGTEAASRIHLGIDPLE